MLNKYYRILYMSLCCMLILFSRSAYSQSGWYELYSGTSQSLNSVSFVNAFTGYMVGDGLGIKTTNGGFDWFVIPGLSGGMQVKFLNANTGFVSNGSILKTTDGGLTWINEGLALIRNLSAVDANIIFGVGDASTIIKSTNGGASWVGQNAPVPNCILKSVAFIDALTGVIVGAGSQSPGSGVIFKTNNGGTTWRQIAITLQNSDFRSICFADNQTAYMVGGDVSNSSGFIFKSTNQGEFWSEQGITNRDLNSVYFVNTNTGYAVGEGGMVLKTVDGSILWNSQLSNTSNDLYSVYFPGPEVGYTAGVNGDIQKTINGGTQGPPYSIEGYVRYSVSGAPVPTGKVVALNYNYVSGAITIVDTGRIVNGYYNMVHIPGGDSTDVMAYQDDEVADFAGGFYNGGSGGTIYWSSSRTLFPTGNLTNINISVDSSVNRPAGARKISGGVYTSVGGLGLRDARVYAYNGASFYNLGFSKNAGLYSVMDLPPGTYTLYCDRMGFRSAQRVVTITGTDLDSINFYLNSVNPIGISNQNLYLPKAYGLMQNYPNPFNPVTNIRFDVPKQANVRLSVYDILGREVEVLVNENLKPGTYKVDWQAARYSSGMYFYKLVADGFIDVKKMVLVK